MLNEGLFSSRSDMWATPQDFFDKLDEEFKFEIDVCATSENAKCSKFYSISDDGLAQKWVGMCWMNPPYGREIGKWVRKAYESGLEGATVVCLLPSRTDTKWFQDYCLKSSDIRFIRGRLKFGDSKNEYFFLFRI